MYLLFIWNIKGPCSVYPINVLNLSYRCILWYNIRILGNEFIMQSHMTWISRILLVAYRNVFSQLLAGLDGKIFLTIISKFKRELWVTLKGKNKYKRNTKRNLFYLVLQRATQWDDVLSSVTLFSGAQVSVNMECGFPVYQTPGHRRGIRCVCVCVCVSLSITLLDTMRLLKASQDLSSKVWAAIRGGDHLEMGERCEPNACVSGKESPVICSRRHREPTAWSPTVPGTPGMGIRVSSSGQPVVTGVPCTKVERASQLCSVFSLPCLWAR